MTRFFLTLLFAAAVRQGFADDKAAVAAAPVPSAAPAAASDAQPKYGSYGVSAVPSYGAYAAAATTDPDAGLSRLDHLRLAARHLKAAGLTEEAGHVREFVAKEEANSKNEPIIVQLRMFEVSLTKLGELSSEKYGGSKDMTLAQFLSKLQLQQGADGAAKSPAPGSDDRLRTLYQALRKDGLARLVSEPNVVTVPGRPAYVSVGGEIGYPTKDAEGKDVTMFKEYGTRADVVANLGPNDRIHLDLRVRVSEVDAANSVQVGKNSIPAIKAREVETALNLHSGQTALIGGIVEQHAEAITRGATHEVNHLTNIVETFVLVKAEIATKETAAKALIER